MAVLNQNLNKAVFSLNKRWRTNLAMEIPADRTSGECCVDPLRPPDFTGLGASCKLMWGPRITSGLPTMQESGNDPYDSKQTNSCRRATSLSESSNSCRPEASLHMFRSCGSLSFCSLTVTCRIKLRKLPLIYEPQALEQAS